MKAGKWIFGALASVLVLQAGLAFADQSLLTLMQGMNPQRRGGGCRSGKCYQDPMGGSKWGPIGH